MRRVAVLRPPERAGPTLAALFAGGVEAISVPLFRLAPVAWSLPPGQFDALALTSANAVRLAGALPDLPAWTVGPATAAAARAVGLTVAYVGDAGADALFAAMRSVGVASALWLAGADRALAVPAGVVAVTTYRAEPIPVDPGMIAGTVALAHSTRAAARLAELLTADARAATLLVAISEHAATAAGIGWEGVAVAARPDDPAMVAAAIDRARGGADKRSR